jgi:hypothetical protein
MCQQPGTQLPGQPSHGPHARVRSPQQQRHHSDRQRVSEQHARPRHRCSAMRRRCGAVAGRGEYAVDNRLSQRRPRHEERQRSLPRQLRPRRRPQQGGRHNQPGPAHAALTQGVSQRTERDGGSGHDDATPSPQHAAAGPSRCAAHVTPAVWTCAAILPRPLIGGESGSASTGRISPASPRRGDRSDGPARPPPRARPAHRRQKGPVGFR